MRNKSLCKKKIVSFFMVINMLVGIVPVNAETVTEENSEEVAPVIMIGDRTVEEYNEAIETGELEEEERMAEAISNGEVSQYSLSRSSIATAGKVMNYYPGVYASPITIDGKVAYCADSSKTTPYDKVYNKSGNYNDDVIRSILYHGYPNNASGLMQKHKISESEARYYTQVAIWQHLGGPFAEKSRGAYFDELLKIARTKDLGEERKFSLSSSSVNMTAKDDYQESPVITTSGSTGTFTFPSNNNVWSVDVNGKNKNTFNVGESFIIRSNKGLTGSIKITVSSKLNSPITVKWIPDDTRCQTLIQASYNEDFINKNQDITLTFSSSSIVVTKTDEEGNKLKGVVFGLYSDKGCKNEIERKTTDGNGELKFTGLSFGKAYYVKEVAGLDGYEMDTTVKSICTKTAENKITVKNIKALGNIKIEKVDADNNDIKIAGTEFTVYNSKGETVDKITTNDKGIATSKSLPLGTYKVVESKAATGYISSGGNFDVKIDMNNKSAYLKVTNKKISASIIINKIDASSKNPLEGAEFGLFDKNDKLVTSKVTDKNGRIVFENVLYGSYKVKEVKAPTGYVLNSKVYDVEVNGKTNEIVLDFDNKLIQGVLELSKIDADKKEIVKGATLRVKGIDAGNSYIDKEVVTGEKVTTMNLPFGRYEITEVVSPTGYVLSKEVISLNIEEDGKVYKIPFENKKIYGKLSVLKRDKETESPLLGAKFMVKGIDKTNEDIKVEFESALEGNIIHLPYGNYKLVEVEAPLGYIKDETEYEFSIDEDGKVIEYVIDNSKIKSTLVVSKVDKDTRELISGAKINIKGIDDIDSDINFDIISETTPQNIVLPYGKYEVVEVEAPEGYILDQEVKSFEVKAPGEVIEVTLENKMIKGFVEILKVDEDNKEPLAGAKFEIINVNEENFEPIIVESKEEAVTVELEYGIYSIKEILPPVGYVLNDTPQEVIINEDGQVIQLTFENKMIEGELEFKKTDLVTGKIVKGATIQINGLDEWNKNIKIEFTSKDKEEIFKLLYGRYEIIETIAPKGYIISQEVGTFEIKESGEIVKGEIKNERIKGELIFKKVDSQTGKIIEGAKIRVKGLEEINEDVEVIITSTDKEVEVELPSGKYEITEIEAPVGYLLSDEVKYFEIIDKGEKVEIEYENKQIKGKLQINKIDSENEEFLDGAKFKIKGEDETYELVVTKENNRIELPYGDYEVIEIEAPEGYELDKTAKNIKISEDGELVSITVVNTKILGKKPDLPYTGGRNTTYLVVAGILIVLVGTGLVIYATKKRSK